LSLRAYIESSVGLLEWGVYLINTIKKPFESLIAELKLFIDQKLLYFILNFLSEDLHGH